MPEKESQSLNLIVKQLLTVELQNSDAFQAGNPLAIEEDELKKDIRSQLMLRLASMTNERFFGSYTMRVDWTYSDIVLSESEGWFLANSGKPPKLGYLEGFGFQCLEDVRSHLIHGIGQGNPLHVKAAWVFYFGNRTEYNLLAADKSYGEGGLI